MDRKKGIRQDCLTKMQAISPADRTHWQRHMSEALLKLLQSRNVQTLALYYGFAPEFETVQLMAYLKESLPDLNFALPRIEPERQMTFRYFNSKADLETVQKHIQQPKATCTEVKSEDIDLMLVPGLAFQRNGWRIGFGGGYYDRFLAKCPQKTLSLVFPPQLYETGYWEGESHDIRIDEILTMTAEGVTLW